MNNNKLKRAILLILLAIAIAGFGATFAFPDKFNFESQTVIEEKNPYFAFTAEVYEMIKENYWEEVPDEDLSNLYKLAMEKLTEKPQVLNSQDKEGVLSMLEFNLEEFNRDEAYHENKLAEFTASLSDIVLANLRPFGRSRLYTSKSEKELIDTIENRDESTDLYEVLGVERGADAKTIEDAHKEAMEKVEKTDEAALAQINRAFETLSQSHARERYNQTGAAATVAGRQITPDIFYIRIGQYSLATLNEFYKVADSAHSASASSRGDSAPRGSGQANLETSTTLILDLRGNFGGAVDILPYFLGHFIGHNQYAYEFFHRGEYTPFKTQTGWLDSLVPYKKVVILIDDKSQSSAEIMAATLKKYNVGVLVGTPTMGWGTIEQVMQLKNQMRPDEKYSVFLVHSVTLRDDNEPIEGRGVEPMIDIRDSDWERQLLNYYNYPGLVKVVKELW